MVDEKTAFLLARMRDSLDAITMEIDKFLGAESKEVLATANPSDIVWTSKTGAKGPFELCDPKLNSTNKNYKTLLRDLQASGGRKRIGKHFYWVFPNNETIGRKESNR